jgi:hypothetical protein
MTNESMTSEMKMYLQVWADCYKVCTEAINHCSQRENRCLDMTLLCLLRDCAEMCQLCSNMMIDGSEFMGRAAILCAEMCEKCAIACEQLGENSKLMDITAACRQCAVHSKFVGTKSMAYFRRTNLVTEPTLLHLSIA